MGLEVNWLQTFHFMNIRVSLRQSTLTIILVKFKPTSNYIY